MLWAPNFYDNGQALPTLARKESAPQLWVSPADAAARKPGESPEK